MLIVKTPCESVMGLFLFATHTTVCGALLYHIPRYLFLEFSGEKKPSSNLWPYETKVSPSTMDWVGVMVSDATQNFKKIEEEIKEQKKVKKGSPSIYNSEKTKRKHLHRSFYTDP